jgi:hypothetical protein
VADGGLGWACGLVEIDDPLLRGDEQRERRNGLGDRGEAGDSTRVAALLDAATGAHDTCGGEWHRPGVDLAKCLHLRRCYPGV